MPTPDPNLDPDAGGRIDIGAEPPVERVRCPACRNVSTETDACGHCGYDLGIGIVNVYAGP